MAIYIDTNTDDIANSASASVGGANTPSITMGWFMPTGSLVADSYFAGVGQTPGIDIGIGTTDTSKLRITSPTTTTWVWQSNETGLFVLDKWTFWAVMHNAETTTDTMTVTAWCGTIESAPTELTMNLDTTGSGNISSGATTGVWGSNATTSSVAQLGHHGAMCLIICGASTSGGTHPLAITSVGQHDSNNIDLAYRRFVLPFWEGNLTVPCHLGRSSSGSPVIEFLQPKPGVTVGLNVQQRGYPTGNAGMFVGVTGTGSAASQEREPRAYHSSSPHLQWVRR